MLFFGFLFIYFFVVAYFKGTVSGTVAPDILPTVSLFFKDWCRLCRKWWLQGGGKVSLRFYKRTGKNRHLLKSAFPFQFLSDILLKNFKRQLQLRTGSVAHDTTVTHFVLFAFTCCDDCALLNSVNCLNLS